MNDLTAVVDLLNAAAISLTGRPAFEPNLMASDWQSPSFELARDTQLAASPKGGLVGYAEVIDAAPHVRLRALAEVHPRAAGRGVGSALATWLEKRGAQSVPCAPCSARVVLVQERLSTDRAARALLESRGYALVRHEVRMQLEFDEAPAAPPVPEPIVIRPFVRHQEEQALVEAMREGFRDHWGYVERPFDEDLATWTHMLDTDPDCDPSVWFVAVAGSEVVGTCMAYLKLAEDPELGWIFGLSVRPAWRRRGIGLALLAHALRALYERGKRRAALAVDAESLTGALRLYEKAGMQIERSHDVYEKELRPGLDLSTQPA
jgi:mycothiol synthase